MPNLCLGVIDLPYAQAPKRLRSKKVASGTTTTGDVAGWLEAKYHVMEHFFEAKKEDILSDVIEGLEGAIETMLMGGPAADLTTALGGVGSKVDDRFRKFLDAKEIETLGYPGIPTQAALRGVNHRMKHPYKRRAPRPSFVDTGLYEASFKSWVEK